MLRRGKVAPNNGTEQWRRHPRMTKAWAVTVLVLVATSWARGQMQQQKDLVFPQVAAGPDFQSTLLLTNRGDSRYLGTANFWQGQGLAWNPRVNGQAVTGSQIPVILEPGRTLMLRIDDWTLTSGVVAILAGDSACDNFIEGNLTYSYQGGGYDSVGIAPAVELYRSVIPFENFDSVGLALANPRPTGSVTVRLRLFDKEGAERETVVRELVGRSHEASFLSETFSAQVDMGKVEIESTAPIVGTALTLARGEISALPMLPSPVSYSVRFRYQGRTDEAEAALWVEGEFVKGYLRFLLLDGQVNQHPATYLVSGSLTNGDLRLITFSGRSQFGQQETINSLKVTGFSFDRQSYSGGFTRVLPFLSFPVNRILGNFELVRKD